MKLSQKLTLRLSEIRTELAGLAGLDELDDAQRARIAELRNEMGDCELRYQAAVAGEDDGGAVETRQDPQRRELKTRSSVAEIYAATLEHRGTSGATAELQAELGLQANQIPLALIETRAVTPAPTNTGQTQAAIIPAVFPQSVGAFLGIDMPTVGTGDAVFPVMTSRATVHAPAAAAPAAETTGAFTAEVLQPSRLQAAFFYNREDRARFAGMDAALRMNLSDALSDALDLQILAGPNGLLTGTNLANNNVSAQTTFALYISQCGYSRVDGRFATTTGDVRTVMGAETYAHAGASYRDDTADWNALDQLARITAGVRVSAHVPAAASSKQNMLIRRGMRRDMVAPIWEGVTLIPDEITKAANGQIVLTAVMLYAAKIIRTDGFYKQQAQHVS